MELPLPTTQDAALTPIQRLGHLARDRRLRACNDARQTEPAQPAGYDDYGDDERDAGDAHAAAAMRTIVECVVDAREHVRCTETRRRRHAPRAQGASEQSNLEL